MNRIRIGTRGSNLALIQAGKIRDALQLAFPGLDMTVDVISTKGDRDTSVPLHKVQTTGVFVKELEQALMTNRIDIAVHSLKDVPSELPKGLSISAVLERDDPRDALLRAYGEGRAPLTGSETVGTSSLRRKAQLLRLFPGVAVIDIRGNIETRLSKLDNGLCDATILAACGMDRAGYSERIAFRFSVDEMLPAACQGIIAVEQRTGDTEIVGMLERINHPATLLSAKTERAFLRTVEGGCRVPVACHSRIDGLDISISGLIAKEDGGIVIQKSADGKTKQALALAERLAGMILDDGGKEILKTYVS